MNTDNLFDYIKVFFNNKDAFSKLTPAQKAKHHFMLNRFMAIKYPLQANRLNLNGIDGSAVADSWQLVARQYKRVPGWIYTKTKGTSKNKATLKFDKEMVSFYLSLHKMSEKDFEQLKLMFPDELKSELKGLERQIKTSAK